jgi:hypothetical protein
MSEEPRGRGKPGAIWMRLLPILVLALIVVIWAVWKYRDSLFGAGEPAAGESVQDTVVDPEGETAADALDPDAAYTPLEKRWVDATGWSPVWPDDFDSPADCAAVTDDLRSLGAVLDGREYVRDWDLPGGSFDLLVGAVGDLDERRPVVEGELTRYGSILRNVTHLFRVLGEERLRRLAELTTLEPELAEPMALTLYRWMRVRERCAAGQPRGMSLQGQYDYAAFVLTTVGGQAYLRRRLPRQEALATFYALMVIDQAVESGYNPLGIDPRHDIARCIGLMERQDLLFGERYLAILEDMRRRWASRTSLGTPGSRNR